MGRLVAPVNGLVGFEKAEVVLLKKLRELTPATPALLTDRLRMEFCICWELNLVALLLEIKFLVTAWPYPWLVDCECPSFAKTQTRAVTKAAISNLRGTFLLFEFCIVNSLTSFRSNENH